MRATDLFRQLTFGAAITALAIHPQSARAQEPGALLATVIDDATQRPLTGAAVLLTPGHMNAVTDMAGLVRIEGITEGLYTILARQIGYAPVEQVNVRITRGKVTIVTLELKAFAVKLETISVLANEPFPHDAQQTLSRATFNAAEIRRAPGAIGDIFRAIESVPGASSNGGEFSAFSVRGAGPHDNLILIDGIPFDKVTHLEGGAEGDEAQGGRFSIFAPDLVESADFRAGGFPAQYGGKYASLLSIKLKDGNTETGTFAGRYDLLGWEADYDGPSRLSPTTSVLFSARHDDLERALKVIGKENAGHPDFTDVIVKTTTTIDARNRVSLLGVYAPEHVIRTPANVLTEDDTTDTALYDWNERKGLLGASWRLLAGDASVIQTVAYGRRYTRDANAGEVFPDARAADGSVAARPDIMTTNEAETEAGIRSTARFVAGSGAVVLSVEGAGRWLDAGRSVTGADTLYTFDQFDPRPAGQNYLVLDPTTYNARFHATTSQLAGSAAYERHFGDNGSISLGGRYEHDQLSGANDFVPRANITLPTVAGVSWSAAGGIYLQRPDLKDLAANPANAVLPAARAVHLVTGVSALLTPEIQFTAESYYRDLTDLPVLRDRTTGIEDATGTGYAAGVDVAIIKRLTSQVWGQVSYSYAVSKRNDHRGAPVYDADGNQPHSFTVLAGYTANATWSFSAKYKIATGVPTDSFVVHDDIFPGSVLHRFSREIVLRNGRRFPDLQTLNFRVDYLTHVNRFGIDAFIDILNAYDHLNVTKIRFVERTGAAIEDGTPLVPTVGFKLLF